jgi:hypothetical protein
MMGRAPVADLVKDFAMITKEMKVTSWDLSDSKIQWVDTNTAVHTYKWTGKGIYQGQPTSNRRRWIVEGHERRRRDMASVCLRARPALVTLLSQTEHPPGPKRWNGCSICGPQLEEETCRQR